MIKRRHPIYLDQHTVAMVTVYTRPDNFEDIWVTDFYPAYDDDKDAIAEDAAFQFIEQLGGRYTQRFLKALKVEIERRLDND